jgi:hypothetical protein
MAEGKGPTREKGYGRKDEDKQGAFKQVTERRLSKE